MILQYVSDTHLEFRKNVPTIQPIDNDSVLAMLGDIGYPFTENYKKFIAIHSNLFKIVIVVSGNHEYYSDKKIQSTTEEIDAQIEKVCSEFPNVIFLNGSKTITIGDTTFIGCTLWADSSSVEKEAEEKMNDYKNIYIKSHDSKAHVKIFKDKNGKQRNIYVKDGRTLLQSQVVTKMHFDMKAWIENKINSVSSKNIIVLTHHAPSQEMLNDKDYSLAICYASKLDDMIKPPITHWLSGHTHYNKTVKVNNVILSSNCMGYPGEKIYNFNHKAYITFK